MSSYHLILASASPRRQDMLTISGISFEVVIPNIEEEPLLGETGYDYVLRNAREKAAAVAVVLNSNKAAVLSADTIVLTNSGQILEKPFDPDHAKKMLLSLSNADHSVLTGYCLSMGNKELISRVIETKVYFRNLSLQEIEAYIHTGEPFDKAGAYGIQGHAMGFVERIEGSYTNVMGLPLSQVIQDLSDFVGIND